ncbi:MAG: hypothetical protein JXA19_01545 [Anaerolineales bacterium]|nr:hypothetical protein [Anaerolineales bacterium]
MLDLGHKAPTATLADQDYSSNEDDVSIPGKIYTQDATWIEGCDLLLAEISSPSHGVGYEIAYTLEHGGPVLCVHQAGRIISKMLTGKTMPGIIVCANKDVSEALMIIRKFLDGLG